MQVTQIHSNCAERIIQFGNPDVLCPGAHVQVNSDAYI
jgi:hypothetical protein